MRAAVAVLALGLARAAASQSLVAEIPTNVESFGIAANPATNQIYIRGASFPDSQRVLLVINGADNSLTTVPLDVETAPGPLAAAASL